MSRGVRDDIDKMRAREKARIERMESLADQFDDFASHASYNETEAAMETWLSAAVHIRAALEQP